MPGTVFFLTISFIVSSFVLLSQSMPLYLFVLVLLFFYVTIASPIYAGYLILFFIPWINVCSKIFFHFPAIPALLLFLSAWFAGYVFTAKKHAWTLSFDKDSAPIKIMLFIFIALSAYALYIYRPLFFDWDAIVVQTMFNKDVPLKNALGWITLSYLEWSAGPLFFFFIYDWIKRHHVSQKAITFLMLGLLISVFVAAVQIQFYTQLMPSNQLAYYDGEHRVWGGASDMNAFAYVLLLSIVAIAYSWFNSEESFSLRLLKLLVIILCMAMLVQTGSRSAFAGIILISFFAVLYLFFQNDRKSVAHHTVLLSLSVFLVFFIILSYFLSPRFNAFLQTVFVDRSFAAIFFNRIPFWKTGIGIIKENPWFGTGIGRYLLVLPEFLRQAKFEIWPPNENTANYYMQIVAEMGLAGVAVIVSFIYFVLKKILAFFKRKPGGAGFPGFLLSAGVMTMIGALFFGPHLQFIEVSTLFWFLLALISSEDYVC